MTIRIFASVALLLIAPLCMAGGHGVDQGRVAAAIASADRPPEHRERDLRSKPEVVLALLNIEPGDTVADIFGGGGYYAELIAGMVGPDGTVILQNNTPYSKWVEKDLQARYGDNKRPPITLLKSEVDDLQLTAASLDAALMVMSYHDLHYNNPERGWGDTDVPGFFRQVYSALKPGGRLVIVDHAAAAGTGSSAVQKLHRIDEAFARAEIGGAGLEFVTTSDALRNPADDHSKLVFDPDIRGKTDRFILVFERPVS